mmetsp:Transcript_24782/g.70748  ORF Transcript_24782/g.70748 Transcript_24782/m.70748 type:complete len:207 (-) Transcript_24782:91-711(-)
MPFANYPGSTAGLPFKHISEHYKPMAHSSPSARPTALPHPVEVRRPSSANDARPVTAGARSCTRRSSSACVPPPQGPCARPWPKCCARGGARRRQTGGGCRREDSRDSPPATRSPRTPCRRGNRKGRCGGRRSTCAPGACAPRTTDHGASKPGNGGPWRPPTPCPARKRCGARASHSNGRKPASGSPRAATRAGRRGPGRRPCNRR